MLACVRFFLKKNKRFIGDYPPRFQHAIDHGLYDVNNVKNGVNFYRAPLDLEKASTLLSEQGLFWDAFKHDLGNEEEEKLEKELEKIRLAKSTFLHKREAFDRSELKKALEVVIASPDGNLVLLLGGKSTGKTLTLQSFKNKTIYVNGRDPGSLSKLLGSAIPVENHYKVAKGLWKSLEKTKLSTLADFALSVFFMFPAFGTTSTAFNALLRESPPDELLKAYLGSTSTPPTIIIDEFNRFLSEESKKEENRLFLELLVQVTKESNQSKIILASSEHAFPFRLNLVAGGNFSQNATKRIFAGEVPPQNMIELLTVDWKMGPSLASVFIACYGGHIWNCALAVDELLSQKEKFRANSVFGSTLFSNVTECIDSKLEGMDELLREVAQVGFAPITKNSDPRAQIGSQYNVLGVVDPYALVIGVPESTYKAEGVEAGVVPASQSMRLVIAQKLSKNKTE